jgi:hypothetical protein
MRELGIMIMHHLVIRINFDRLKTKGLMVFVRVINSTIGVKFEILNIVMVWIKT